jgi:wyosine [tRNA(Phe)-imidazoG37] synthetase (radical SAM superfamily)
MLVKEVNDSKDGMQEIGAFIHRLKPQQAYLSIPTRPPAERWARGPGEEILNQAYQIFAEKVKTVKYLNVYEGDAFAFTGDLTRDLLGITAVHPMRKAAINTLLSRAGSSWAVVEQLVAQGELAETKYQGHTFYMKSITKKP